VLRKDPFESADLVLTNSRWTAEIIKDFYGEMPEVLNPPIPPNTEISAHPKPFEERSNSIVMLGRFSEEKRYHWVVSDLLPALRKDMDAKLYIIGGARTPSAANYLNKIGKLAIRAGFRVSRELKSDSDVYLLGELKREEINMVMDLGKVFFHATINEHWGIAIAEGMARALPVVVHRSGGAWSDLVEMGQCGLGYGNGEAAGMLSRLLADRDVWSHYSRKAIERARGLTLDNFVSRFDSLLRTRSMI
jgi:glycosyltransferase involved in cell wall biosynthesis